MTSVRHKSARADLGMCLINAVSGGDQMADGRLTMVWYCRTALESVEGEI